MTATESSVTPGRSEPGVAVELIGLRRTYGGVHALDGLDLRMQPGAEDRDQILGYIQEVSASGMRWDEG